MARKKVEQTFSTPIQNTYVCCQYEGCIYPARLEVRGKWVCTDHYAETLRAPRDREPGEDDE